MRGSSRRIGRLRLRDLFPLGRFHAASKRRRRWLRARRPAESTTEHHPLTEHYALERHILDYRMLDGVRLGFGEIYADH